VRELLQCFLPLMRRERSCLMSADGGQRAQLPPAGLCT
jgi:hypothetical protein